MGTTLAVMIGLLAPTADLTATTNHKVYGDSGVVAVGFSNPTSRHRQTWPRAAAQQFSGLSVHYSQEEIPRPSRPGVSGGGIVAADSLVNGQPHGPSCECDSCRAGQEDCGHGFGCNCRSRLPNSWRARCNLPQHQYYVAEPKTYYYFRAYTHIHTAAIQEEAIQHGAPRTNPYDTKLFAGVYEEMAKQLKADTAEAKKE